MFQIFLKWCKITSKTYVLKQKRIPEPDPGATLTQITTPLFRLWVEDRAKPDSKENHRF